MTFALFRSSSDPNLFGFTADAEGSNLPAELGPWEKAGGGTAHRLSAGADLEALASSDLIIKAVEEDGYFLAMGGLTTAPASGSDRIQ